MADADVATKAPESDAQESSLISSEDTPAQSGQSMGVKIAFINVSIEASDSEIGALYYRSTFAYVVFNPMLFSS